MNWKELLKPDIYKALALITAVVLIASKCAYGDETRIYAGVGHELNKSRAPECHDSKWTGVFGIERQFDTALGPFSIGYVHNSCFDEQDDFAVSDRIEVQKVWVFP